MKISVMAATLAMLSQPAAAQGLLGEGCFLRAYTPDHLARHPDQQVTIIALRRADRHDTLGGAWVELSVGMRAWDEVLQGSALCDPVPAGALNCQMEGDAGAFRLDPARGGALRLTVAARGVMLEGTSDFAMLSGTSGDDRVFLIPPVDPVACR
jgi:hypothetical protein